MKKRQHLSVTPATFLHPHPANSQLIQETIPVALMDDGVSSLKGNSLRALNQPRKIVVVALGIASDILVSATPPLLSLCFLECTAKKPLRPSAAEVLLDRFLQGRMLRRV
eukprot:CAMPEP_0173472864 /NCGR_PEP_ID=MMETSP1357-20121228/79116_1 /TAXON_ID=77926 /ORGANISM="Hemiselmis rufescens, Strain PCC563" /LENGTH=109 /DNA_ID=CAMNT_0014441189 /DNA_START=403 /DNA_END=733 /DNA_ORIENTATION=+